MPNLLMLGKQYEAYVTVLEDHASRPLVCPGERVYELSQSTFGVGA